MGRAVICGRDIRLGPNSRAYRRAESAHARAERGGEGEMKKFFMRHFKLPLIATAITLAIALVAGIALITVINRAKISDQEKNARAEKAGGGMAVVVCIIIAPFWIIAAAKFGKERREALAKSN